MNQYEHLKHEVDEVVNQLKNTQYSRAMFLVKALFNSLLKESEERSKLDVDLMEQRSYIQSITTSLFSMERNLETVKNKLNDINKPLDANFWDK